MRKDLELEGTPYEMISLQTLGTFMLFGEINQASAMDACEFIIKANLLHDDGSPLTMLIHSEGGCVNSGFSIIDVMDTSRLPVQTVGTGLIASMALLVLSAGHKGTRTITKNTQIMAHQWASSVEGKYHELVAVSEEHKRLRRLFVDHFRRHSSMSEKQINDVLFSPSDRWLTPQECKRYGLVDKISEFLEPAPISAKSAARARQSPKPTRRR